jgi:hypothetical protein
MERVCIGENIVFAFKEQLTLGQIRFFKNAQSIMTSILRRVKHAKAGISNFSKRTCMNI